MKIQILTCFDLTDFFITFVNEERKFREKKTCQTVVVNFFKFQFLKNFKFSFAFFEESGHFWTWKMQNLKSRHQH